MSVHKLMVVVGLVAASAPAAAGDRTPSTLQMREPRSAGAPRALQGGPRVAQPSGGTADDPANAPAPNAPTPDDPTPSAPPPSAPAINPASPKLTDDERAAVEAQTRKTEVISVTDTPIERERFTGVTPISIVGRADLAASGRASLGDILQALPGQGNASNAQVNAGGDSTARISLRGLGAPRTLVLINGRRLPNGGPGADAAVDINTIPLAIIERVEILKEGASALYGADAVGGVVNVITRPQFDGVDVSLLTSTSEHADGTEYDASGVAGVTSGDKNTYLVVAGGYQRHGSVMAGDRDFSTFQDSYDFATRTVRHNLSLATPGGRLDTSSIGAGGKPPPGCSGVCTLDSNGNWTDFMPRDEYNDAAGNYLYTPSTRYHVFGTAGNRINDHAAVVLEAMYQHRDSSRQLSPVAFEADVPISKDSIYNPTGGDILDFRRRITELGPRQYHDNVNTVRLVAGVTGTLPTEWGVPKDWNYEISETYGYTRSEIGTDGQLNDSRLRDALGPSMLAFDGTPICVRVPGDASTFIYYLINTPMRQIPVSCRPLNIFAPPGKIPASQLQFTSFGAPFGGVTLNGLDDGRDEMHTLQATTSGRITRLPDHGEISLSLGTDYHYEHGHHEPSPLEALGITTDNGALPTDGSLHTYDGFGELRIVPFSGHEIARRVEIDLGARWVRDSRFGSTLTYKAGGLLRTVEGIAVRSTYATAFRAPSVTDLFGGRTTHTPFAEDPCDTRPPSVGDGSRTLAAAVQAQCAAQGVPADSVFTTGQQTAVTGGNSALTPEKATTVSIGVVYEPPEVKGLAVTADYWHIGIDNAIETLGLPTIFANCYDRGIQSFCDQIHRDPTTHRITSVDELLQNVTRTVTSGIDLAVWYDAWYPEFGRLHGGLDAQYLLRYDLDTPLQVIHGVGYYDLGVYPRYKANLSGTWSHPSGTTGGLVLRYVGGYQECAGDDCNNPQNLAQASRNVDRYFKLDLFGSRDLQLGLGKTTLQLGVNNVFDATPPAVYNAPAANSDPATYDFIGRMVYVRLSQRF